MHSRRNLVGLRMMLSTLLLSLPMLLNVAAVTLLVYFIFAVVGVELFGNVVWSDNIGPYANFQNTGTAMLTLFRMMTGALRNLTPARQRLVMCLCYMIVPVTFASMDFQLHSVL